MVPRDMVPRVVITGMGVVSPNGIGKEAFCQAILAGKSGIKRISRFDPSELPVQIAGEIPEFDELAWVDPRERKHVSRVVPLAIAASAEAIKDSGLDPSAMSMDEKREIGVILGTGGGGDPSPAPNPPPSVMPSVHPSPGPAGNAANPSTTRSR